jgi:hypothetical protein
MDRPDELIPTLDDQERRRVPTRFDNTDAGSLGRRLADVARERGLSSTAGMLAGSATP